MPVILIIKSIAGAIVLSAVAGSAYIVKDFTGTLDEMPTSVSKKRKQVELALKMKSEQLVQFDNEPGEKAFRKAKELLAIGSMVEAEERLKYVISNYPAAKSATGARRILGEMNVDRLLDPQVKEGKHEVVVKSGDMFSQIVSDNKTTMDSIIYLTGRTRAEAKSLQPGDKLIVMPLEMRAVISVRRKTLTIYDEEVFVKEYPILKSNYTGGDSGELTISSIRGVKNGKSFPSHMDEYITADKIITLSDKSIVIRSNAEESEDGFSIGFSLAYADMAELPLLLRAGNKIEIKR